jgi:hypothetical protein
MGLANLGAMANAPVGVTRPRPPNQPPSAGHPLVVPVNLKPLNTSSLDGHDKFVFRGDSAGLGVPRGTLGKLNGFSGQTAQHGMASTSVSFAPRGASEGQGRGGGNAGMSASAPSMRQASSSGMQSAASSSRSSAGSAGSAGGGGHR